MHEQRGTAFCAKADSGAVVYEKRLDQAGQVYSSAFLADGRLYYLTRDGRTFVLAAKPKFEQLAMNDLSDGCIFNGSPAIGLVVLHKLLATIDCLLCWYQPV